MKNKNKQTKFPVARIKKIMQKDEEVGKVAQATPIVISKALELFLGLIIEQSSKVTSERGSKKLEAYHLKHAVETTETLDFLKELVQDIPDPSAGGTIDFEAGNAEGKKKRGKGKRTAAAAAPGDGSVPAPPKRRRKKRADTDNDDDAMGDAGAGGRGRGGRAGTKTPPEEEEGDTEMRDEEDDYDEEESMPPPRVPASSSFGGSSSGLRRPQSPSDDEEDKPYMPPRK
ncbi:NCT transcriptional regulatory complex subunit A [Psilocybe cubensis]|uniref:Transcription factor CBF/NF-Y/archaeal histone domain-containing protein n=2 Tax=Psilocybe cubensis TaxID=181762 RepID=A0A8H8CGQ5_PSICU|nr:NCT transcriptional regulatory complex subunit A [Psilocybe cubensis]KAH9475170.1 NCT transcriptional regulatory complex subunit A [Psilocybe cubensis]